MYGRWYDKLTVLLLIQESAKAIFRIEHKHCDPLHAICQKQQPKE